MQVVMEMRDYLSLKNSLEEIEETLLNPGASKYAAPEMLKQRNDYARDVVQRALARLEMA
jgi:hypothetical protein